MIQRAWLYYVHHHGEYTSVITPDGLTCWLPLSPYGTRLDVSMRRLEAEPDSWCDFIGDRPAPRDPPPFRFLLRRPRDGSTSCPVLPLPRPSAVPPPPTAQLYGLTLDADSCCDATWLTLD